VLSERLLLVISDLHMGVGALDDFDAEIEKHFVGFLGEWRANSTPVELVINGDLLDFVQAPPFTGRKLEARSSTGIPLCFTQQQSLDKLTAIAGNHAPAFGALREFLKAGKSVTILPGNHDADFFWPDVRSAFARHVCGKDRAASKRLRIHLDPVYRPKEHEHLWIEHGHQFDPLNAFFVGDRPCWSEKTPPIRATRSGENRLYECVGTRFLIRYINKLDADYPFVDNVKPFSRFLQIFFTSAVVPGYGPLKAAIALAAMWRYLETIAFERPSDLLEFPEVEDLDQALTDAVEAALPGQRAAFAKALAKARFRDDRSPLLLVRDEESRRQLSDFLADHLDIVDTLGAEEPEGVMALGKGFIADETDDLRQGAERILDDPSHACRYVTMGQTHESIDGNRYFNTGSWTRYYQHVADRRLRPWSMLRTNSFKYFPYALKFLRSESGPPPRVTLGTFAHRDDD
jgi:UDP-2,3-diacylglucosamine pyrophosphatase LpxH